VKNIEKVKCMGKTERQGEDDVIIARSIKKHLENWEYEVQCTKDFSAVTKEFAEFAPQLVLMDIGLPFYNGYYWCSEIRKISKVPIIFLSSAADNMNIVMAVNMGADDFIAKPFDLSVLTVKVQAMLRRTYDFTETGEVLTYHGVMLQVAEAVLTYQDKKVELTRNELRILKTLMENKEKVVSRDTLMTKLWESDCFVDENTLSVNVNRLRRKLADAGLEDFILTKKGIGYRLK
jgi:two-component system response regulator protein BraR/BceR